MKCPPAPCRRSLLDDNDTKHKSDDFDDDSDIEDGIRPLDGTFELETSKKTEHSSKCKRQRLDNDDHEKKKELQSISDEESRFSSLKYLEASGIVSIRRRSASTSRDDCDRRECKMQISYRINKDDANDVQIALIVYKNVNNNLRSRRNLIMEFDEQTDDSQELLGIPIASTFTPPSTSRCRTVIKDRSNEALISTAPCAGEKVIKATKRPITSRNCLRF